ncbi:MULTISPECIES: hypothetical protein [unclassified Bradyrhizobium]
MDADNRAAFAEAKARSCLLLDRDGYRAEQRSVEAAAVVMHHDEPIPHRMSLEARRQRMEASEQARHRANVERREREVREVLARYHAQMQARIFVDSRISAAMAEHDEARLDAHSKVISHERKRVAAEVEKLRDELGELRAELTIAKAHRGEVVEVPQFLERRHGRAQ